MYKIIGNDQKIYGPVPAEQIRRWITEGRVNASTLAQAEGSPEWKPLSTFPEFAAPPLVTAAVPPLTPPPAAAPSNGNSMATTGFILGLLSVLFFWMCCFDTIFAVLGVIFSSIALTRANADPQQKGKGMATAGLILSLFGLAKNLLFASFWSLMSAARHFPRHWNF